MFTTSPPAMTRPFQNSESSPTSEVSMRAPTTSTRLTASPEGSSVNFGARSSPSSSGRVNEWVAMFSSSANTRLAGWRCVAEAGILSRVGDFLDLVDEKVLADDRAPDIVRPADEQLTELRFDDAGIEGLGSHLHGVIETHSGDCLSHLSVEQRADSTVAVVKDGLQAKIEHAIDVTVFGAATVLEDARAVLAGAALDEARTLIEADERPSSANRPVRGFDGFLGLRDAARLVERDGVLALVLVRDRRGDVVGDALLEGRERVGVLRPDNELHLGRFVGDEADLPHGIGVRLPEIDDLRPDVHPFLVTELRDILEGYPVE